MMAPALESGIAAQLARHAGQTAVSRTLNHFDESGTVDRLRSFVGQAAAAGAGGRPADVPRRDGDNLAAASHLRKMGVDDRVLVNAFHKVDGLAYGSNGLPVFVGRDADGDVRYLAALDGQNNLQMVPGSDPRFGMHLAGQSDRVVVYDHPLDMLCDASARLHEGPAQPDHGLAVTDSPAVCVAQFLSDHPDVRQVELRMSSEKAASVAATLEQLGFGDPGAGERFNITAAIPLADPVLSELPDGRRALVTGEPQKLAETLKSVQGDNSLGYLGTCGIVSCGNVMRLFGIEASEDELVRYAALRGLCTLEPFPDFAGATNADGRTQLLAEWGLPARVVKNPTADFIAREYEEGRGVIVAVNAGILWDNANFYGNGFSNHAVTVTGTARDENSRLLGVYICDSGRLSSSDAARFVPIDLWREAVEVPGGSANVTERTRRREMQ